MSGGPTVFVLDDNRGLRDSLRALMQSAGLAVETYASSEEFLRSYRPERSGCLVLDVRLRKGASGLDVQDELRRRGAMLPIIVLTGHANVQTSVRALQAGAVEFLQKPVPPPLLVAKIRAAIETDERARAVVMKHSDARGRIAQLTPRERAVMTFLVEGKTSKEIAYELHLSVRTVEAHRRNVLRKMNVTSASQLVRVVIETSAAGR